jgi:ABC-type transport system involved in Fe-S cluster assembly fused permease/ATPase subunit
MTVGKFVLVNTYLMQLYQPLNLLGMVYREITPGLVDMERCSACCAVRRRWRTSRARRDLSWAARRDAVRQCGVRLRSRAHRSCAASPSPCPPASKLAIVGPSGAGKSTISALLFRFYDVSAGAS